MVMVMVKEEEDQTIEEGLDLIHSIIRFIRFVINRRREEMMEVATARRVLQSLIRGFAIGYAIKMSSSILFEVLLKTHGLR